MYACAYPLMTATWFRIVTGSIEWLFCCAHSVFFLLFSRMSQHVSASADCKENVYCKYVSIKQLETMGLPTHQNVGSHEMSALVSASCSVVQMRALWKSSMHSIIYFISRCFIHSLNMVNSNCAATRQKFSYDIPHSKFNLCCWNRDLMWPFSYTIISNASHITTIELAYRNDLRHQDN